MQQKSVSFHEAELQELPIDHAKIGAYLAERWALPQGLIDGLRWHHEFQPDIPNANFVMIIYLANILVNSYDENPDCTIDMSDMHPEAVKFLMRQLQDTADWYSSLSGEIEAACELFLESDV